MKGCDPTIDHGSEHIERLLGVAFREMDDGGRDAYVRCVALILPDLSHGRARCGLLAHAYFGAGVSVRMQRAPRSIEPRVGLIEPACQQQERCARGQGGQDYWVLAPTVASPMPTAS
jgi:hypothetical protein